MGPHCAYSPPITPTANTNFQFIMEEKAGRVSQFQLCSRTHWTGLKGKERNSSHSWSEALELRRKWASDSLNTTHTKQKELSDFVS